MTDFYTHVTVSGSKILYRGVSNGKRIMKKIDFNPKLYLLSKTSTEFKTIHEEYLQEVAPGNIFETKSFIKRYDGVEGFKIFGNQKFESQFIAENFPGIVEWDKNFINIANIDIEVASENGFAEPEDPFNEITAITIKSNGKFTVFGCGNFKNTRKDVTYYKCQDEIDLLKRFIDFWSGDYPDIVTGWNIRFYDIPYMVNRIGRVLGEEFARRLSPWKSFFKRGVILMGKERDTYTISGIATFDYIELYRKFAANGASQSSYSLNNIAHVEIGEKKISYEEYGSLHRLYIENYQKFIEYNIQDTELVEKIDDKLGLIDLALTLAYDSHSNYDDVFMQVRMWDNIIYSYLRGKNVIVPPAKVSSKKEKFIGAYVKVPQVGLHKWVVSFDLNSLYPHLMIQFNISPDSFLDPKEYTDELQNFIHTNDISIESLLYKKVDTKILKDLNLTMTPNGQFFKRDKKGFFAELMKSMYADRVSYKKKSQEAKKLKEKETDTEKVNILEKDVSRYNNLQLTKKICLNSAYGASGSEYFRFFDVRQAAAVTSSGQLVIRWIENRLNNYLNKLLNTNKDYCIASDTDSVYLDLDELVQQTFDGKLETTSTKEIVTFLDRVCEAKLQPFIDKSFRELAEYTNAVEQKMVMKREKICDKGIWTAKKRYVVNVYNEEGIEYAEPKIKVTGLEMIKSTTPAFCKEKLNESLKVIMNKDQDSMIEFIQACRKSYETEPINDIAMVKGMNGLEDYSEKVDNSKSLFNDSDSSTAKTYTLGTPIHVRGSIVYNELLRKKKLTDKYPLIKSGEKLKYLYLKEPNPTRENIIAFTQVLPKEFGLDDYIDYELNFNKSFLEPLKVLLNHIGWETEKRISLDDFFS